MQVGEITGYIDVAQVTLYAFWVFFAGLIIYLRTEDKREGISARERPFRAGDRGGLSAGARVRRSFRLSHGGSVTVPASTRHPRDSRRSRCCVARCAARADRKSDARWRRAGVLCDARRRARAHRPRLPVDRAASRCGRHVHRSGGSGSARNGGLRRRWDTGRAR